jgi:hypothetical protein
MTHVVISLRGQLDIQRKARCKFDHGAVFLGDTTCQISNRRGMVAIGKPEAARIFAHCRVGTFHFRSNCIVEEMISSNVLIGGNF